MDPILVTGATGNVGRQVVRQLTAAGLPVRALTRDPDTARLPDTVAALRGDLADPDSLDQVLHGVGAVFLVWPFGHADGAAAAVDAIARHARRVVYLSSLGAATADDPISRMHNELERLIESTDLRWTHLRPGGFATNTLSWAAQVRAGDEVRGPYADLSRPLVHEADLATVAVRALTSDAHHGARYPLTGPAHLTQAEQVATIGDVLGRPLRYVETDRAESYRGMVGAGWPPDTADAVLDAWYAMRERPEPVLDTVAAVTGRPARTYRDWVVDHAADFTA
ncbi:NAD(P)H-binding protein [Actinocatenispora rupis]|uniref:Nucleotide-diphosphate-sugar epimerase n=1 Tax=Actinocatenispora rupis TaxID=519421 RepID=A0A8J3NE81_9ACTN|nr:NAD(P)H-binding protein [Actinocatenispora rupis]GID15756.1 nucleotide-diphosphate-sugar epimerase [Actinocatenispora rupis]